MGRLSKRELLTEKKTESKKKKQTMKKKLFKTRLLSFVAFCGLALAFASCANEDVAQGTTGTDNENDKNLTTFVAGDEAKTRTTMDYNTGNFYWEAGDYIYVKDDNNVWRKSSNAPTGKVASFKFKVPGKFTASASYKVYYPGKNGSNDQVTIPAAQSQSEPNSTAHFGVSGDCGTATATGTVGGGSFSFALDHQAAILVLQPYNPNATLNDCYLTKVEVTSDNNITGTYTLDPSSGELTGAGTGKQIVVTTAGSSVSPNGFPIKKVASVADNSAYVLIKPGTHTLTVKYTLKDIATNVEGTITKTLSAYNYDKNTYYDMTANLDIKDYDGDHYYMWDAQQQYWYGYEWTKNLASGVGQPTLQGQPAGNYAQNNGDVSRWCHEGSGAFQATQSCATLPNANEMSWYCMYGDPRWDADELWTTRGHLYKGGMWFKKKSVLLAEHHYDTEKSADGSTDMRTTYKGYSNSNSSINNSGLPSAADANKYFYLPALADYYYGQQNNVGGYGLYWSSSAHPSVSSSAYSLYFLSGNVGVTNTDRLVGLSVGGFE